ncbi:MAG TPA: phage baseplate assembly protein V [Candidatus Limnocylindrales bacterium]|nr:phage baseplate assembly protein V [Candidatus Limnocylindrales bacterium]
MINADFFGMDQVDDDEEKDRKIYGVTTGRVIRTDDVMGMGRVQVQVHSIDSVDLTAWARVAVPMAGILHGTYFVPHIGDTVLLAFEHGDVNAPYIIGSVHDALHPPPLYSPLPEIRAIRTVTGNQIVFSELTETIAIQTGPTAPQVLPSPPTPTGPHQTIMMSPAGVQVATPLPITLMSPTAITLQVGASAIQITPAGVIISGPQVSVGGGANVTINAGTVLIN